MEEVIQGEKVVYMKNLQENAVFGIKYMEFQNETTVSIVAKGHARVGIRLGEDSDSEFATISIQSEDWEKVTVPTHTKAGVYPLFVKVLEASGPLSIQSISFQ